MQSHQVLFRSDQPNVRYTADWIPFKLQRFHGESALVSLARVNTESASSRRNLATRAREHIAELTGLEQGWDGHDGVPVRFHAARMALEFLRAIGAYTQIMPDIVPLSNGGLQLEWFVGTYEVEVEVDPSLAGSIHVSFECTADERYAEIPVNDPRDVSGIAPYFKELSR